MKKKQNRRLRVCTNHLTTYTSLHTTDVSTVGWVLLRERARVRKLSTGKIRKIEELKTFTMFSHL